MKEIVKNTEFFPRESFAKLEAIMVDTTVPAGHHLFWEGDLANKLFYLRKGRVKITKSNDEGKSFVLYMLQEGDLIGELDPFRHSRHSFNAEVIDDANVGVIQKHELEALLIQHGDLAIDFIKWMGLTHRITQTKFRDLMLYGKLGGLCSTLIRLSNSYGIRSGGEIRIGKKMTNAEIAEMIGTTRESVNRMLSEMKKESVIRMQQGHIVILDVDYLRNICHCEQCPAEVCRI